jgi:hypothetical protein
MAGLAEQGKSSLRFADLRDQDQKKAIDEARARSAGVSAETFALLSAQGFTAAQIIQAAELARRLGFQGDAQMQRNLAVLERGTAGISEGLTRLDDYARQLADTEQRLAEARRNNNTQEVARLEREVTEQRERLQRQQRDNVRQVEGTTPQNVPLVQETQQQILRNRLGNLGSPNLREHEASDRRADRTITQVVGNNGNRSAEAEILARARAQATATQPPTATLPTRANEPIRQAAVVATTPASTPSTTPQPATVVSVLAATRPVLAAREDDEFAIPGAPEPTRPQAQASAIPRSANTSALS